MENTRDIPIIGEVFSLVISIPMGEGNINTSYVIAFGWFTLHSIMLIGGA